MTLWINKVYAFGSDKYTVQCGENIINQADTTHVGWTITNSNPCYFQSGDFKVNFEDNNWKLIMSGSVDRTYSVTDSNVVSDEGFGNYAIDLYWIKGCFSLKPQNDDLLDIILGALGLEIFKIIESEGPEFFIHLIEEAERDWDKFLKELQQLMF